MGQQINWAEYAERVFMYVSACPGGQGEAERCTSCRGCRVSLQGGAAGKQRGASTPHHPNPCTRTHKHTQTHANTRKHRHITPLHPTALQEGVGEGTLHSSKPQLMHNSCTSSNSHILLVGWGEGSEKIKFHYSPHTHL